MAWFYPCLCHKGGSMSDEDGSPTCDICGAVITGGQQKHMLENGDMCCAACWREFGSAAEESPAWTHTRHMSEAASGESTTLCPDCGGTVSVRAPTCPHCGAPLQQVIKQRRQPTRPTQSTNTLASASFACALVGLLLCGGLLGPVALILGMVAVRQIRERPHEKGEGLATAGAVIGLVETLLAVILIWYFWGNVMFFLGSSPTPTQSNLMEQIHEEAKQEKHRIERDVAADAVRQYEIAKRSGNAIDAYVYAGIVAAAYLQANDEENYERWKEIERQEGIRAGMPDY